MTNKNEQPTVNVELGANEEAELMEEFGLLNDQFEYTQ